MTPTLEPRQAIRQLIADALEQERALAPELSLVHPLHAATARNLAHYLALRQHDLRELQGTLAALGLSSLGRSERCVLATLQAVDRALTALAGEAPDRAPVAVAPTDFASADALLQERARDLLGSGTGRRTTRTMVTLSLDAEANQIEGLLADGTDAVRINCAKGSENDWGRLVERVRFAAGRRGRECKILCDLAGPNPRTVDLKGGEPGDVLGRVGVGDRIHLRATDAPSGDAPHHALTLGCSLPTILADLAPGDRIFYDDGKLAGVVRDASPAGALFEVSYARKERVKVRADKGLNFPDSKLTLPSLTDKDRADLRFIAKHADLVGLSFVRTPSHVEALDAELDALGAAELGLVLKIETTQAFQALPRLLLAAMRRPHVGIMVARGDMAIEMGFERLAEAQEEVLWLSEAAFLPVIWATQVLDILNQTGLPSRAEVTDAAMGGRAECVMLNQGRHQREALRFLQNVLERMEQHQHKKRTMLRRLRISTL
jgi:pyruvate kinase